MGWGRAQEGTQFKAVWPCTQRLSYRLVVSVRVEICALKPVLILWQHSLIGVL